MIGNKRTKSGFTLHLLQGSNRKANLKHRRKSAGFTLVELLVGMAVFSLVILTAIGLLLAAIRNQRKAMAIQNVLDNGRHLISFMAKEIRMSEFTANNGEAGFLDIIHPINGDINYTFSGAQILRNNEPLNSDEVKVEGKFFVSGKAINDDEQPQVTIVMKVETIGIKVEEQAKINLQTTLSQRELD